MNMHATRGCDALTEKEKQTLRLIVRGHDAKSIARTLDLSVHTINERLRDARRKLAVSSSREAARRLFDTESETPHSIGDMKIREAFTPAHVDQDTTPIPGEKRPHRFVWTTIGAVMTFALGLFALMALPQAVPAPVPAPGPPAAVRPVDAAVVDAARQWLALVDQGRWDDSYRTTGTAFRKLNTSQVWANVSERVRTPLGAMISRVLLSQEELPAPPNGYQVVKFRTSFANKAAAVETVTLEREDGGWHVVGVTVE